MDNFTEDKALPANKKVKNSFWSLPRKWLWTRFTCDYRLVHWFKQTMVQQSWRQ